MPPAHLSAAAPARARWLKLLLTVHWISSAVCLLGLLLFSITGFTLNHAGWIEAKAHTERAQRHTPAPLLAALRAQTRERAADRAPLPTALDGWLADSLNVDSAGLIAEWSDEEIYLPMPRPGGDAWLRIDLADGALEYERTDRGWIAWLNDLHKGRHTGEAWRWFIDALALGCLVFALSGLLILQIHARQRLSTWPLLGLGVVLPVLLALLWIP